MKFTKWFWISAGIMIFLFILPTILSYDAPSYDGRRNYGFPFDYYSWGGLCYSPDGEYLCAYFSLFKLVVDIIVLIGVPFVVNFVVLKLKR